MRHQYNYDPNLASSLVVCYNFLPLSPLSYSLLPAMTSVLASDLSRLMSPLSWLILSPMLIAAVLYTVYRSGFPKPLPGIPYNEISAKRFTGDLPELLGPMKKGLNARPYTGQLALRFQSPLVQIFPRPFRRPAVVVNDHREATDILLRRSADFQRSSHFSRAFSTIVPNLHLAMQSHDPHFKSNKELVRDLMTPWFLHSVR